MLTIQRFYLPLINTKIVIKYICQIKKKNFEKQTFYYAFISESE